MELNSNNLKGCVVECDKENNLSAQNRKISRTRRRPSNSKAPKEKAFFQIKAIVKSKTGCAIRIRRSTRKKIQLYDYKNTNTRNVIKTNPFVIPKVDTLKPLINISAPRVKQEKMQQPNHIKKKAKVKNQKQEVQSEQNIKSLPEEDALCSGLRNLSLESKNEAVETQEKSPKRRRHRKKHPPIEVKTNSSDGTPSNNKPQKATQLKQQESSSHPKPPNTNSAEASKPVPLQQVKPKKGKSKKEEGKNKEQQCINEKNIKEGKKIRGKSSDGTHTDNKQQKPTCKKQQGTPTAIQNKSPRNDCGETSKPGPSQSKSKKEKGLKKKKEKSKEVFEAHLSEKKVIAGIKEGKYIRGVIRINPKYQNIAFVTATDLDISDFYIKNVADRNQALNGDVVAVELLPDSEGEGKTSVSKIVYIFEKVHPRTAIGHLTILKRNNRLLVRFIPRDRTFPVLDINKDSLPSDYKSKINDTLFLAVLTKWNTPNQADGEIRETIGRDFEFTAEQRVILLENKIDISPFPKQALEDVPQSFEINEKELSYRLDLRTECVFTIDPLTARDLDDALHIKQLTNGNYEVGVHIADVAHYLQEESYLDKLVSKRATSTYLIDQVVHMLPKQFCLGASLLPHKDSLTFSVIWELTPEGDIVSKYFTRSIIFNCVQLAYEHAQFIIDYPDDTSLPIDFPVIAQYTQNDIRERVLMLNSIARHLRKKRLDNGALKIGRVVIAFDLDENGVPFYFYEQKTGTANEMIEEFMLLANISVANEIYSKFPQMSLLRRHDPPKMSMLVDLQKRLDSIGLQLQIETSEQLGFFLREFSNDDIFGHSRNVALSHLLAKSMMRAVYFNTADMQPENFYHYALSVPKYTHFTSPIRRYPDIIVHRLLGACLNYNAPPNLTKEQLNSIANNCNKMKYEAKRAGEDSNTLMLLKCIQSNQPFIAEAVVVGVSERAFDAIVLSTGSVVRVFMQDHDLHKRIHVTSESYANNEKIRLIKVFFKQNGKSYLVQVIDIFQIVKVALQRKKRTMTLQADWFGPKFLINDYDAYDLYKIQMRKLFNIF